MKQTHNFVYHSADSRGYSDFSRGKVRHTFSFRGYHNEERMHFGALRALNDGIVGPDYGLDPQPYSNMEVLFIPLYGALHLKGHEHEETIEAEEQKIQLISTGRGVEYSVHNPSHTKISNVLHVWIYPNRKYLPPSFQQVTIERGMPNQFRQFISPYPNDLGGCINQNAWGFLADFTSGTTANYKLHDLSNGVYVFVIFGSVTINDQTLLDRDGYGIWTVKEFEITCNIDAKVLLLEVPMFGYGDMLL